MLKYLLNLKNTIILVVLSVIANVLLAFYFSMYSWVTNAVTSQDALLAPKIALLAIFIVLGLFCFFSLVDYIKCNMLENADKKLKDDMMAKIFSMNHNTYHKNDTSYYSSLLLNDCKIIKDDYFTNVIEILGEVIQLCVMLFFTYIIEWRYIPIIAVFLLPSIMQPFLLQGKLGEKGLKVAAKYTEYTQAVREFLRNFETIKIFRKETIFTQKFSIKVQELETSRKQAFILNAINSSITILVIYFLKIGLTILFVNDVIKGGITLAAATALFGFSNQIGNPVSEILGYIGTINESKEVRQKVLLVLSDEKKQTSKALYHDHVCIKQEIVFDNITFTLASPHLVVQK